MKREVVGSLPISLVIIYSYLPSTLIYCVPSLVRCALTLVLPRSPCLPTTRDVPSSKNPTALASRNVPDNVMSAKGKKAAALKTKGPSSSPVENRIPVRSPIDDGMRSQIQMHNLSPSLQGSPSLSVRRRSGGKELLLSLDMDRAPRKKK